MRRSKLKAGDIVRIVDMDGMLPASLKKYEGKSGRLMLAGSINCSILIRKSTCDAIALVPTHLLSKGFEMEVK